MSLGFLALLGYLMDKAWFYQGLGVSYPATDAMALILFMLVVPLFTFLLQPLVAMYSRKHEFEADAYAAQLQLGARAGLRAGQALQGQRLDADARPAALGVLRFAPAGAHPHREAAELCFLIVQACMPFATQRCSSPTCELARPVHGRCWRCCCWPPARAAARPRTRTRSACLPPENPAHALERLRHAPVGATRSAPTPSRPA